MGLLVGLLAENEHRLRESASAVTRIMRLVRMGSGIVGSVEAVLEELLAGLDARRAVLILSEEGSDRRFVWEMTAGDDTSVRRVRPLGLDDAGAAPFTFAIPAGANAWYAERPAAGDARRGVTVAVDAFGPQRSPSVPRSSRCAARRSRGRRSTACRPSPATAGAGACSCSTAARGGRARISCGSSRSVLTHVGPALFNLYLQRRLQSRAGVGDRARAARELHDGVIQSLAGVEMMLEAIRRGPGAPLPADAASQLAAIQDIVRKENLNIRDLMQLLRPDDVDTSRLVEHLADLAARFQRHSGIQTRFVSDVEEITLPPRVCRELARAVHEALVNVRKHSGARNVLVRVTHGDGRWLVVVDDDGRGFDFAGRLAHEQLDRERRGPVILKEHVRAMGGELTIQSAAGNGLTHRDRGPGTAPCLTGPVRSASSSPTITLSSGTGSGGCWPSSRISRSSGRPRTAARPSSAWRRSGPTCCCWTWRCPGPGGSRRCGSSRAARRRCAPSC